MTRLNETIEKLQSLKEKFGDIPICFSEIDPFMEDVDISFKLCTDGKDLYIGIELS